MILAGTFGPVATIKVAIADGLGDVVGEYTLTAFKIGNGTGHLEDAAVGTGREREALHGGAEHIEALAIGLCKLMDHPLGHLGVTMDVLIGLIALFLNLAGLDYTFSDNTARLAWLHLGELRKGYYGNLAMQVDPVE